MDGEAVPESVGVAPITGIGGAIVPQGPKGEIRTIAAEISSIDSEE